MKFVVDWVSEDHRSFGIVSWSRSKEEAVAAYLELDAIPNSDGVLSSVTEESAIRSYCHASMEDAEPHIVEETKTAKAYFMRLVLPSIRSVKVGDKLTISKVRRVAGA